jgi:serine/threonine protein kinase
MSLTAKMRICPQCKTNFGEQEFRVCPFDGAALTEETAGAADPMLGRILDGRFRIIETIGQGGMGAVYKAVHTQMDRICAIKLLSPVSTDKESAIARFRREAKMTSRIDSPNAVTIYDFGEAEPGLLYIAMEYIDGESLAELLARERSLAIDRVVSITNQIARALAAAHSLGIIHRDLKPANIMLTRKQGENEVVKVLDFGIAKTVTEGNADNLTQTGFILGTPTYMSPEQVLGEGIDSRSDVYSLSIIVYQMLSGQVPFEGDNLRTLMMKRLNSDPRPLRETAPSVNEAIEHVVMSGLTRDPEMRIADVQKFAAALNAASMTGAPSIGSLPSTTDNRGDKSGASTWLAETRLTQDQAAVEHGEQSSNEGPTSLESHARPVMQSGPQSAQEPAPTALVANSTPLSSPSVTLLSPSVIQERVSIVAPQSVETIVAAPMRLSAPAVSSQASGMRQSKLGTVLIVAFVVIVIAVLSAGGYYIYLRAKRAESPIASNQPASQTSQPNTERNTGSAPTSAERAADDHYKVGKLRQEQSYSLANAGSGAAAAAKNEEAIAEYRKALESRPNFPQAHENLGVALYDLGKAGEAVVEYEIAIKQYEKPSSQVSTNYGIALLDIKRFQDAADAFSQALVLQPDDADLHYYRGFALHYAGDRAGSRVAFSRYLEVARQGPHARDVKEILEGRAVPSLKQPRQ